jgi:hypothetical protein
MPGLKSAKAPWQALNSFITMVYHKPVLKALSASEPRWTSLTNTDNRP